jgi:hypothetical protein
MRADTFFLLLHLQSSSPIIFQSRESDFEEKTLEEVLRFSGEDTYG